MSPFTLATLDTSWVVQGVTIVTISMMDQLSPGAGTVCHVSCTRGVCHAATCHLCHSECTQTYLPFT